MVADAVRSRYGGHNGSAELMFSGKIMLTHTHSHTDKSPE